MASISAKGMLFDNDGILISSIGSVIRCWREWARMYGVSNWESYEVPHGVRALDIVKSLRPDIDAAEGLRVIENLEIADTSDIVVLPGVRELLARLPQDRWAVVTSATLRLLEGRWAAAQLPFPKHLIAADHVVNGKPHPEPYEKGAALLGLLPKDCIVVEDAPSGVGAGKAAGCRVLGVLGTHSIEELKAAKADWVVESLAHVKLMVMDDGLGLEFTEL